MKIFSVSLVQKQDRQKQNKQQKTFVSAGNLTLGAPLLTDSDAAADTFLSPSHNCCC